MTDRNPFRFNPNAPECDSWQERSAIMEFDGGLSREEAERLARENEELFPARETNIHGKRSS